MTPDQLKSLRATFDAATFDVAPKNAVDCPFMSSDIDDSYPWYYVRSSDGAKAAAFACEEDAECYAAARQAVLALIEEVERLSGLRGPVDALERVLELEAQLAAMTAARDEACEIALQWAAHLRDLHGDPQDRVRVAALRKVGQ
jgi:hypothetical protein